MIKPIEHKLSYSYIDISDTQGRGIFSIDDMVDALNYYKIDTGLVNINEIIIPTHNRRKGYGTKILQDFCEKFEDNLIMLTSAALLAEYREEPDKEEYNILYDNLDKFFLQAGFINVTPILQSYEVRQTYIYDNKKAKELINSFKEEK